MTRNREFESRTLKSRRFELPHEEPREMCYDYILLPFGYFYEPTKDLAKAKRGDIIHFFNGGDYVVDSVAVIKQDRLCDMLCRARYGIAWKVAFERWLNYALMAGCGKDVLSREYCIFIMYEKK